MDTRALFRRLVPYPVRRGLSAGLARVRSSRLRRELAALAADQKPIVAGPWLGEVGFELLYWVPFLRWFAAAFNVAPDRLVVVSRGGTAAWYQPFAGRYREIFDLVTPEEFRRRHDERIIDVGEQKQTRVTAFERDLLAEMSGRNGTRQWNLLHPLLMYRTFNPYWWGHLDEGWVHAHADYRRLGRSSEPAAVALPACYTAVKFYFNECFPPTDANAAFVRDVVRRLADDGPVVSLTTGLNLDDHGGLELEGRNVLTLPPGVPASRNLHEQSAIVAGAARFVGTYGGFSYLAPFSGVPAVAYYSNPDGFFARHLAMARSALARIGTADLLETRATRGE